MPRKFTQITLIILVLISCSKFLLHAQLNTNLNECSKIYDRAKENFKEGNYQLALNKLEAAKLCSEGDSILVSKADELLISIYKKIEAQRNEAIEMREISVKAQKETERQFAISQDLLGDKYLAQARMALSKNDFKNVINNIDKSLEIKSSNEAKLLITQLFNRIPPSVVDKIAIIFDFTLNPFNEDMMAFIGAKNSLSSTRTIRVIDRISGKKYEIDGQFMTLKFSPDGKDLYVVELLKYDRTSGSGLDAEYKYEMGVIRFSNNLVSKDTIIINEIAVNNPNNFGFEKDTLIYDPREYQRIDFTPNEETMILSGMASKSSMRGISNPFPHHLRTWISLEDQSMYHDVGEHELSAFHDYKAMTIVLNDSTIVRDGISEVFLIDIKNNKRQIIGKHTNAVQGIAANQDGKRIACIGDNNQITVLEKNKDEWKQNIIELTTGSDLESVIFIGNNEIAVAGSDNIINLISLQINQILEQQNLVLDGNTEISASRYKDYIGHSGSINSLSLSTSKKWIISTSEDNTTRLWSLFQSNNFVLEGNNRGVVDAILKKDDSGIYTISKDGNLLFYNLNNSNVFSIEHDPYSYTREISVNEKDWDEGGGLTRAIVREHLNLCRDIIWDENKMVYYTIGYGNQNDSISIWKWSGRLDFQSKLPKSYLDSLNDLYFVERKSNLFAEIDQKDYLQLHSFDGTIDSALVAFGKFSPSGQVFVSMNKNGNILIWDVNKSNSPVGNFKLINTTISDISKIKFSKDEKIIAFPCNRDGQAIGIIDLTNNNSIVFKQDIISDYFDLSPNGKSLVVAGRMGEVYLYSINNQKLTVLGQHSRYVTTVAFSPNGDWVASGSRDRTVRLWDINSSANDYLLFSYLNPVEKVLFSPNGEQIFSVSGTGVHSINAVSDEIVNKYLKSSFRKSYLNFDKKIGNVYEYKGELGIISNNNNIKYRKDYISSLLNKKITINTINRTRLIKEITSSNSSFDQKERAIYELSTHGELVLQVIEDLIDFFSIPNYQDNLVLNSLQMELFPYTGEQTEQVLVSLFRKVEDKWIKLGILQTLIKLYPDSPETNKILNKNLEDSDIDIRLFSALHLVKVIDHNKVLQILTEGLYSGHDLREDAAERLKQEGDEGVPYLIWCLRSGIHKFYNSPRELAKSTLMKVSSFSTQVVLDSFNIEKTDVKIKADLIDVLGEIDKSSATLLDLYVNLINECKDSENKKDIVTSCVYAIRKSESNCELAIPTLIDLIQNYNELDYYFAAYSTLSRIGQISINPILKVLPNSDFESRSYFYKALLPFKELSDGALPYLIKDLNKCTNYECSEILDLLGVLGPISEDALPSLFTKLENTDQYGDYEIAKTIGLINRRPIESTNAIISKMLQVARSGELIEYKSSKTSIDVLRKFGVPEIILLEIGELNDMARDKDTFSYILYRDIGYENMERYGDLIFKHCLYNIPHYCDRDLIFREGCKTIESLGFYSDEVDSKLNELIKLTASCSNINTYLKNTINYLKDARQN